MWWPFGKQRKGPPAVVDAGANCKVDLRPLAEEAFRLRPSAPADLFEPTLQVLVATFNEGKTALRLCKLGMEEDDADFISNRVMKWAYGERDAVNRRYLAKQQVPYFKGVELKPDRKRCAEAAANARKVFPLDRAPRIPFASCDQTICHCMIRVVTPRRR